MHRAERGDLTGARGGLIAVTGATGPLVEELLDQLNARLALEALGREAGDELSRRLAQGMGMRRLLAGRCPPFTARHRPAAP
jgi:hypothetical protein